MAETHECEICGSIGLCVSVQIAVAPPDGVYVCVPCMEEREAATDG